MIAIQVLFLMACVVGSQAFFWRPSMVISKRSVELNYNVKIVNNKKKSEFTVDVPAGKVILDTAESKGVPIPYSCRAGSCSTCVGKLISGNVDQSGQIFLNDKQIDDGYVLTCVATPNSDCVIEVDVEDKFYNDNPDFVQ